MEILHANRFRYTDGKITTFSTTNNWIFLMSGSGFLATAAGKTYPFPCDSVFMLRPGQEVTLEHKDRDSRLSVIDFTLDGAEYGKLSILPLPQTPSLPPNSPEIKYILRNVCDLYYSADKYRDEKMCLLVMNIFYAIASGDEVCEPGKELYYAMREQRRKMSDNPLLYSSVAEACGALKLSPSHFQHLYQSFFHTSFISDLKRAKIKRAEALLLSTNLTVSDIARQTGFENDNYFYRTFKSVNGITPAKFRKRVTL